MIMHDCIDSALGENRPRRRVSILKHTEGEDLDVERSLLTMMVKLPMERGGPLDRSSPILEEPAGIPAVMLT